MGRYSLLLLKGSTQLDNTVIIIDLVLNNNIDKTVISAYRVLALYFPALLQLCYLSTYTYSLNNALCEAYAHDITLAYSNDT